jgi:hypothetical protein
VEFQLKELSIEKEQALLTIQSLHHELQHARASRAAAVADLEIVLSQNQEVKRSIENLKGFDESSNNALSSDDSPGVSLFILFSY